MGSASSAFATNDSTHCRCLARRSNLVLSGLIATTAFWVGTWSVISEPVAATVSRAWLASRKDWTHDNVRSVWHRKDGNPVGPASGGGIRVWKRRPPAAGLRRVAHAGNIGFVARTLTARCGSAPAPERASVGKTITRSAWHRIQAIANLDVAPSCAIRRHILDWHLAAGLARWNRQSDSVPAHASPVRLSDGVR